MAGYWKKVNQHATQRIQAVIDNLSTPSRNIGRIISKLKIYPIDDSIVVL
jgi:hypothetical protein